MDGQRPSLSVAIYTPFRICSDMNYSKQAGTTHMNELSQAGTTHMLRAGLSEDGSGHGHGTV